MKSIVVIVIRGIIGVTILSATISGEVIAPVNDATNRPAVFPNTTQPIPLAGTNRLAQTSGSSNLPRSYQPAVSNLNDIIGTNAPNRGYHQPSLTNRPNPDLQMP